LRQIADNAGVEGSIIVEKVRGTDFNTGYNAATGEFEDLIAAGIIDPAKVVRSALKCWFHCRYGLNYRGTGS